MMSSSRLEIVVVTAVTALAGFSGFVDGVSVSASASASATTHPGTVTDKSTSTRSSGNIYSISLCTDNPVGWHDSDGRVYDCNWYATNDYCELYGHLNQYRDRSNNKTANDACCACGGGLWNTSALSSSPSPSPSPSPSTSPASSTFSSPTTLLPTITSSIISTAATSYAASFCGCSSCTSKVFQRDVIGNSTSSDNNSNSNSNSNSNNNINSNSNSNSNNDFNSDSNSDAIYTSVGYSISWVMSNWQFSEMEACTLICVNLFPSVCGNECNPEACLPTVETTSPTAPPTTSPTALTTTSSTTSFDQLYPNCTVTLPPWIGNGYCNGGEYNTMECGYDGGDCLAFNEEYPSCTDVPFPLMVGDTFCDGGVYNTSECKFDGGDCGGPHFFEKYPDCDIDIGHDHDHDHEIGNGICTIKYNTPECAYDGGDCIDTNRKFSHCGDDSPNLSTTTLTLLFNGKCDIEMNSAECHYDNGDCNIFNSYPQCWQVLEDFPPSYRQLHNLGAWSIGDGICQEEFNVEKCGFDGGDCRT